MLSSSKNRKSIRKYSNQKVTDKLLNELLEISFRASNTGNMQIYSVIVTRDEEIKKQLSPCHFNQPMIQQASVVLTFCADFNRFSKWCQLNKATPCYDNLLSFITAAIDSILVAQTFAILAEAKGLGICYLGTTNYLTQNIIDILKLPSLVVPITTITVGYPDENPQQTDRLPIAGLIHQEQYQDYTDDAISNLYRKKENLPEMKQFVKENAKETLAQVFTDIRYNKENNEKFSGMLLEVIQKQGFSINLE